VSARRDVQYNSKEGRLKRDSIINPTSLGITHAQETFAVMATFS
jgi:hypothetical protein